MDVIIVSIGTLSKNPFWGEKTPVRSSHATTTLIKAGKEIILVDPSLPPQILGPRLHERTGLAPSAITQVFLTNWRPVHRRGLPLFEHARWWLSEVELSAAGEALEQARRRVRGGAQETEELLASEELLLKKVAAAPDELADEVDLFPLPGYTPGLCGLLLSTPALSTVIAGDAVPTAEHFTSGQVFPDSYDLAKAKESLVEMFEIADVIVPGHDNLFVTPRAGGLGPR